jgi:N-acetylmuramic acid 6-phosphate etherase
MDSKATWEEKCRRYLAIASQFRLGDLPTEKPHPETGDLSVLASEDLPRALKILKAIDSAALRQILQGLDGLEKLKGAVDSTLQAGHRVFICGCGATGRLALALETLWRESFNGTGISERVYGFMAGGDLALIKSIEDFEDVPEYADRQLVESGFGEGDLLISCTEGGETPFVIGATEKALELSSLSPFFLYCNPDEILCKLVERSRRVIQNPRVETISLDVGPMALSGSTRMQASTVLMAAVGFCLLYPSEPFEKTVDRIHSLISAWDRIDIGFLESFVVAESTLYQNHEFLLYETDEHYGISILTDTTERAPTFSLLPFENDDDDQLPSWCYLLFARSENSCKAWESLLRRPPRTLEWEEIGDVASAKRLLGFDFSIRLIERRRRRAGNASHNHFKIYQTERGFRFELNDLAHTVETEGLGHLQEHLLLKLLLNTHSTLVMGRLGRYQGNLMTWVRPSNNKLIDRSIRYIDALLKSEGVDRSYEEIASQCFEVMEEFPEDQSLVLTVTEKILAEEEEE